MVYWTALPVRDAIWLCARDATGTHPVRAIQSPNPETTRVTDLDTVSVNDRGYAAVYEGTRLHVVDPDTGDARTVELPEDLTGVHSICFLGDILYIGAQSTWQDISRLGWTDINAPQPTWHSLDPPQMVGDPNQPIYALMSDGEQLVALDGAFTPKLAVIYDVSERRAPKLVQYVAIPSGIDDQPLAASMGRSYAAILTSSRGESGKAWKIGIFDVKTMDEIATFYQHAEWEGDLELPRRVLIHEDLLLVAHNLKGLGVLRLDDRQGTLYEHVPSIRPWAQSYFPVNQIEYHKPLGQGRIVAVTPTPDPHVFHLHLERGGKSWWEEISLR